MNHVVRSADRRAAAGLHSEIHTVKNRPGSSDTLRMARSTQWYMHVPGPVRRRVLMGTLHRLPDLQRRLIGTVGLTSVGMHGRGAGTGFPFLLHTLDVLVGGLEDRRIVDDAGAPQTRQLLWVSLVADHDVVDGVPLTRFIAAFRDGLESGDALGSST
jgi:hypothetical protein